MYLRVSSFVAGLIWGALRLAGAGAESPGPAETTPAAPSVADEAIKDITFHPPAPTPEIPVALSANSPLAVVPKPPEADKSVALSPYIVRELSHHEVFEVTEAIEQFNRLKSRAAYKKDLTRNVRMELLLPPSEGSHGMVSLPMLRFSW